MNCAHTHEWYELARGDASPEVAERLRRHEADCEPCRARAEGIRDVAARLERLSVGSRIDLSDEAVDSLYRRARFRGLLGRSPKESLSVRFLRVRWVRVALPVAAAAAAIVLAVLGLRLASTETVAPKGSLVQLVQFSSEVNRRTEFGPVARLARAAVSEELARPSPSLDQVGDLLLVAYIGQHPRENRQADDIRFLIEGAIARRSQTGPVAAGPASWPMMASTLLSQTRPPLADADPLAAARSLVLEGRYEKALAELPDDSSSWLLRAWCLESLGRSDEAAQVLADAEAGPGGPMVRILHADLSLQNQDVAEAMRQYETVAVIHDRFWFAAGYLCRYELADARSAGRRFQRVRDPEMAAYVAKKFQSELVVAREHEPTPLFVEDFDSYDVGTPADWALVMTRGSEFKVVEVPRGKALQQDEANFHFQGAEFLTGEPGWSDYTLQVEIKLAESHGDYTIGAAAFRRADHTGYVLELSPNRLRLVKQFAAREGTGSRRPLSAQTERLLLEPRQAQMRLDQPMVEGWWYTFKIRVQRVAEGVSVAGKFWRADTQEPLGWQVVWTDTGQDGVGPLVGGAAGVQISGAKVLIDNLVITQNDAR
jgi:hypothetical protein